jgi:hypothetical protein
LLEKENELKSKYAKELEIQKAAFERNYSIEM